MGKLPHWGRCLSVLLSLSLTLLLLPPAREAAPSTVAPPTPCGGLSTESFTLRPDDPRWPAFLAWARERRLFTFTLVGFTASGLSVHWATGTQWETQVTLPVGQALAHLIAEWRWQDTDFPEFFAPRGGMYGVNLAERLALLDTDTLAAWRIFFDTLPANAPLSAHLSAVAPDGQSAEVTFGSDRVVTYSAQRVVLDLSSFLTDCRLSPFFEAADQSGGRVSQRRGLTRQQDATPLRHPSPSPHRGQVLYEQQCAGCHGIEGDGQGVVAAHLTPRPRDFTRALFRYRSTPTGQLPTDEDLHRSVTHGLAGSGMPAFGAFLSPADIRDMVGYVKQFSPRFERESPPRRLDILTPPAVSAERAARGAQLYQDSGCASCHGDTGKGDGRSGQDLKTSEGEPIAPRDLTDKWRFRGGYSAQAVFQRLATGMDGSSMASYSDALTEDQMWDLVFYVLTLSPRERPQARADTTP